MTNEKIEYAKLNREMAEGVQNPNNDSDTPEPAPTTLTMDLMKRAFAQTEANMEDPENQWLRLRVSQETFDWMLSRGLIDADGYMLDTVDRRDIIIEQARELCRKFINKVESGRARSIETYAECKELLSAIEGAQNMPEPK